MVVSVVFNHKLDSKKYTYLLDGYKVNLLDDVLVPVGDYGHVEVATVVAMFVPEISHEYCQPMFFKHVIAPASDAVLIEQMNVELDAVHEKYQKLLLKLRK